MTITAQAEKQSGFTFWLFPICFLGTVFGGMASTLMSVYLPVAVKSLLGDKSEAELNTIGAYINSVFIFGGALGGFVNGWISDRYGRKAGVIISIGSLGIFTLLTGYMPTWWGVVICRFLSGFGLGGILVTTTTLMMEEWPQKTRTIFVGILSIAIPVGIFSAGVIDYFISSWRQAFLVGLLPLLIAIASVWLLRESAAWKKHRSLPDGNQTQKTSSFSKEHSSNLFVGSVIFGAMLIGLWAIFSWLPTWIQTLITEGDGQKERGISMMMMGMGGLIGGFLSGWLMNAMGIRKSLLICFTVCVAMSFLLFKTNTVFSVLIFAEIAILALFFGISQGVLSVFIPNLFPVAVRGTATGLCFNTGRILTGIAVLFVGVLVTELGGYGNALFIFSFVFVIGLLATIFSSTSKKADQEASAKKAALTEVVE